jgi:hypothetical protein
LTIVAERLREKSAEKLPFEPEFNPGFATRGAVKKAVHDGHFGGFFEGIPAQTKINNHRFAQCLQGFRETMKKSCGQ